MPDWGWVLIAVAAVALVALIVMMMMAKRKTNRLQEQFGRGAHDLEGWGAQEEKVGARVHAPKCAVQADPIERHARRRIERQVE